MPARTLTALALVAAVAVASVWCCCVTQAATAAADSGCGGCPLRPLQPMEPDSSDAPPCGCVELVAEPPAEPDLRTAATPGLPAPIPAEHAIAPPGFDGPARIHTRPSPMTGSLLDRGCLLRV